LALLKKLRLTCEELRAKNKILQDASDLYSKVEVPKEVDTRPAVPPVKITQPTLRPVNSARRIIVPKQGIIHDDETSKGHTFITS
jgi:hypothetical protein